MDEQLQAKIQEARDAGYTDEEINQYLATRNQPLPEEKPIDRYDEQVGVITSSLPETAKLGLELGGGYLAGKKILDAVRGPVQPAVSPTMAPQAGQQVFSQMGKQLVGEPVLSESWDKALRQPVRTPQEQSLITRAAETASKMRQLAAEFATQNASKMLKGGVGVAAALTPGNIGQNYNVPQSGPMRGMEINPNTGRPWTNEELQGMR